MSSWAPTKYKTKNWSSYNDRLKQRGSLSIWFDPEMIWTPPLSGKRGRQQQFSDAATQTCLTLKVLFGMPLRQTTGFVQSLLRLVGLDWAAPDFSTLCRRQQTLNVSLPYRGSTGPLNPSHSPRTVKARNVSTNSRPITNTLTDTRSSVVDQLCCIFNRVQDFCITGTTA